MDFEININVFELSYIKIIITRKRVLIISSAYCSREKNSINAYYL